MKYKLFTIFTIVLAVFGIKFVYADSEILSSYRMSMDVSIPKLVTPTVVELAVPNSRLERYDFMVYDMPDKNNQPSLLSINKIKQEYQIFAQDLNTGKSIYDAGSMVDDNENTYTEFGINGDSLGKIRITINSPKGEVITSDSMYLLLDTNVSLPKTINIKTSSELKTKTILATTNLVSQVINFPRSTSDNWGIELTYGQPLRITEIRFGSQYQKQTYNSKLRFLAQPGHDYRVYFDPDRRVSVVTREAGNLSDNQDILKVVTGPVRENTSYVIADTDQDKIPDIRDNCVSTANTDQIDINNNGRGDVCDDFDKDGRINSLDNCPDLPNSGQQDTDGDKIGDVCDGVESRVTEKYTWLPWMGIIAAALVVIGLFVFTALSMRKKTDLSTPK